MKYILLPIFMASVAMAADVAMNMGGGAYNFNYHTGDQGGHSRSESGSGGNVAGQYSYVDANGDLRRVSYTAGADGFKPSGDIGVDRRAAAHFAAALNYDAAQKAAVAARAPVPAPAPVAPYYGGYHYGGPAGILNMIPGGYVARW